MRSRPSFSRTSRSAANIGLDLGRAVGDRAVARVEHRQQLLDQRLGGAGHVLGLLLHDPLPVVLELGLRAPERRRGTRRARAMSARGRRSDPRHPRSSDASSIGRGTSSLASDQARRLTGVRERLRPVCASSGARSGPGLASSRQQVVRHGSQRVLGTEDPVLGSCRLVLLVVDDLGVDDLVVGRADAPAPPARRRCRTGRRSPLPLLVELLGEGLAGGHRASRWPS